LCFYKDVFAKVDNEDFDGWDLLSALPPSNALLASWPVIEGLIVMLQSMSVPLHASKLAYPADVGMFAFESAPNDTTSQVLAEHQRSGGSLRIITRMLLDTVEISLMSPVDSRTTSRFNDALSYLFQVVQTHLSSAQLRSGDLLERSERNRIAIWLSSRLSNICLSLAPHSASQDRAVVLQALQHVLATSAPYIHHHTHTARSPAYVVLSAAADGQLCTRSRDAFNLPSGGHTGITAASVAVVSAVTSSVTSIAPVVGSGLKMFLPSFIMGFSKTPPPGSSTASSSASSSAASASRPIPPPSPTPPLPSPSPSLAPDAPSAPSPTTPQLTEGENAMMCSQSVATEVAPIEAAHRTLSDLLPSVHSAAAAVLASSWRQQDAGNAGFAGGSRSASSDDGSSTSEAALVVSPAEATMQRLDMMEMARQSKTDASRSQRLAYMAQRWRRLQVCKTFCFF
jgi:hypothetical protein